MPQPVIRADRKNNPIETLANHALNPARYDRGILNLPNRRDADDDLKCLENSRIGTHPTPITRIIVLGESGDRFRDLPGYVAVLPVTSMGIEK
jgi:hypothetical protein